MAEDLIERLQQEKASFNWDTTTETLAMIQYSSGTTGAPKSVMYRHGAITVSAVVVKLGTGLKPEDTYFCPSSPAWGHGIWYGTIAPLIFGKAIGTFSGKFDPEICLEALEEFGVTKMAAIASHYRLIMQTGKVDRNKLKLKLIVYTGEAMTKEMVETIYQTLGIYPYTQYGTTEVGPIAMDFGGFDNWVVKPGSLGKPMIGGAKIAIIDEEGNEVPRGEVGQIAVLRNNKWVGLGDSAYQDEDGYLWYSSRIDDVIISQGYTIGPVEVEEALLKHPAVAECAVAGSPDKERGTIVKAFIKLKEGFASSADLQKDIQEFVKSGLSKHEYPREIEFMDEIPKTPDGKLKRKELREREKLKKGIN